MRKIFVIIILMVLLLGVSATTTLAADPPPDKLDCTKIQDGVIQYSTGHYLAGHPLVVGNDAFGYNYQAHLFSGSYANIYLGGGGFPPYTGDDTTYLASNPGAAATWYWPYRNDQVLMKWDQGWLANVDCDGDGKLDRHLGFTNYLGSGAWETNHQWGSYDVNGQTCNWDYFTKIIAVPSDALNVGGIWHAADGTEIGPVLWGEFATIQEVYNDSCSGFSGLQYISPDHAGFGGW